MTKRKKPEKDSVSSFLERLHSFASTIENDYFRAEGLALVAVIAAKAGFRKDANGAFEEAILSSEKIKSHFLIDSKLEAQTDILCYQAKSGFSKETEKTLVQIRKSINEIKNPVDRNGKIETVLVTILMDGMFREAQELAYATENVYWQSEFLHTIASAKAKIGQKEDAKKLISQALGKLPETKNVTGPDESSELYLQLVRIAGVQAEMGSNNAAKDNLIKASAALSKTRVQSEKDFLQSSIAAKLAYLGSINEALLVAGKIEIDKHRLEGYKYIANAWLKQGLIEKAISQISKIDEKPRRAEALFSIAVVQMRKGRKKDAMKTMGIIDPSLKKYDRAYLDRMVEEDKKEGQYEEEGKKSDFGKPKPSKSIKAKPMSLDFMKRASKVLEEAATKSSGLKDVTERSTTKFYRLLNDVARPYIGAREVKKDFDFPMLDTHEQLKLSKVFSIVKRRLMGIFIILATLLAPFIVYENRALIGSSFSPEIALAIAFLLPIPLIILGFLLGGIGELITRDREGTEFGISLSFIVAIFATVALMINLYLSLPESVFANISKQGLIFVIPIAYLLIPAWFGFTYKLEHSKWYKKNKSRLDKISYLVIVLSFLILSLIIGANSPDIMTSIYGTVVLFLVYTLALPLALAGIMIYKYLFQEEHVGISMGGAEMILPFILSPIAVILSAIFGAIAFLVASAF